ncbi:MAG: hypothetical protein HY965_06445 [Ignavibacteriales bacterium]|nr:hypothetical protein [Ignavibacteriales bacterium]
MQTSSPFFYICARYLKVQELEMEVKIENGKLIIDIEMQEPPPSMSGKTFFAATAHGNTPPRCMVDGKPVIIWLNTYIKK